MSNFREGTDIRNKRILQLESQIGHAGDILAARDTSTETNANPLQAVQTRIDSIENKLVSLLTSQPANNIVINNCHQEHIEKKQFNTSATQTAPAHDEEAPSNAEQTDLAGNVQEESQTPPSPSF